MTNNADPEWLAAWRDRPLDRAEALARFDALPAVPPERMTGRWRGTGLPTGHPLDCLLEALGWYGKEFAEADRVHPLLFRSGAGEILPLNPALMPVSIALYWPGLAHGAAVRRAFAALRPILRARGPCARLRRVAFRGVSSAAMLYDRQPIVDHFRLVDDRRVLGLMEVRGDARLYFFLLTRDR